MPKRKGQSKEQTKRKEHSHLNIMLWTLRQGNLLITVFPVFEDPLDKGILMDEEDPKWIG